MDEFDAPCCSRSQTKRTFAEAMESEKEADYGSSKFMKRSDGTVLIYYQKARNPEPEIPEPEIPQPEIPQPTDASAISDGCRVPVNSEKTAQEIPHPEDGSSAISEDMYDELLSKFNFECSELENCGLADSGSSLLSAIRKTMARLDDFFNPYTGTKSTSYWKCREMNTCFADLEQLLNYWRCWSFKNKNEQKLITPEMEVGNERMAYAFYGFANSGPQDE